MPHDRKHHKSSKSSSKSSSSSSGTSHCTVPSSSSSSSDNNNADLIAMDRLWNNHYWETREVITDAVNAAAAAPKKCSKHEGKCPNTGKCLDVDLDALYDNQKDLGANFGTLSGSSEGGDKLAAALTVHIDLAVKIVLKAIAGKSIDKLYKKWQDNASDIAHIYHKYACQLNYDTMNNYMQGHLETTLAEAVAIIKGDCQGSYDAGEAALEHIQDMNNYLMKQLKS